MTKKDPLKTSFEIDAIGPWRGEYTYTCKARVKRKAKRQVNRRGRQLARKGIREDGDD